MSKQQFSPKRLREARGERRPEWMAANVGVSLSTIRNWEIGESQPTADQLAKIAELTNRKLSWFFVADCA